MLASVTEDGGVVTVLGDNTNDIISLSGNASQTAFTVSVNGDASLRQTFLNADISRVVVYSGAGDDQVNNTLVIPSTVYGGNGDDTISGGSAADLLYGGDGADTIWGGSADDYLQGGEGNDNLRGGEGSDRLRGDGGDDDLRGGDGDDLLEEGTGNDFILGEAGDDEALGNSGNDRIGGGLGNDVLSGQEGDDSVFGDDGEDRLYGQGGSDKLYGGNDGDQLFGGADNDQLRGDAGNDTLYGGDGNDFLEGSTGDDFLFGESGNDEARGNSGNDSLRGGTGNDVLSGQEGDDRIYGGDGDDDLYGQDGSDELYGEAGLDELYGGNDDDELFGGVGGDELNGDAGNDELHGGDGVDTLYGNDGNDFLYGDAGDDLLGGQDGNDRLFGGLGNDSLYGQNGIDLLLGDAGDDQLFGGAGGDSLYGLSGADVLLGQDGDDLLDAGPDQVRDVLTGGSGLDQFVVLGNIGSSSVDVVTDREGSETFNGFNGTLTASAEVEEVDGDQVLVVRGLPGDNKIRINARNGQSEFELRSEHVLIGTYSTATIARVVITTGAGEDEIENINSIVPLDVSAGAGDDIIRGGLGDDFLRGNEGDDEIDGHEGDDVLSGNQGDDEIHGHAGEDEINGGLGNDDLRGGTGNDFLGGNEGNDELRGESGNDTLRGDAGADELHGGSGVDTFLADDADDIQDQESNETVSVEESDSVDEGSVDEGPVTEDSSTDDNETEEQVDEESEGASVDLTALLIPFGAGLTNSVSSLVFNGLLGNASNVTSVGNVTIVDTNNNRVVFVEETVNDGGLLGAGSQVRLVGTLPQGLPDETAITLAHAARRGETLHIGLPNIDGIAPLVALNGIGSGTVIGSLNGPSISSLGEQPLGPIEASTTPIIASLVQDTSVQIPFPVTDNFSPFNGFDGEVEPQASTTIVLADGRILNVETRTDVILGQIGVGEEGNFVEFEISAVVGNVADVHFIQFVTLEHLDGQGNPVTSFIRNANDAVDGSAVYSRTNEENVDTTPGASAFYDLNGASNRAPDGISLEIWDRPGTTFTPVPGGTLRGLFTTYVVVGDTPVYEISWEVAYGDQIDNASYGNFLGRHVDPLALPPRFFFPEFTSGHVEIERGVTADGQTTRRTTPFRTANPIFGSGQTP